MTDEITLDAPETRLERFLAAAAGVEGITLDEPVTRIEKYLYKIAQGGASGGLPPVTETDAGKVLAVANSGVWGAQEPIGKKFIVTLTIDNTEPIQGTMDKSIGEIEAAYNAGRRVEFELQTEDSLFIMPLQYVSVNGEIWSAYFSAITDAAMLFSGYTSGTSDKTSTDFGIDVYTLTHAT